MLISLLISAQIILKLFGKLSLGTLPSTLPSYADFSGFMLAGVTSLAPAHTLRAVGHIRMNRVTARLPQDAQVITVTPLALLIALLASDVPAATMATIRRMSVPELTQQGYSKA